MTNNYHYGIIGNCSSAALISSDCSIDWLCLPFFDSASLFARMLDKDIGGYFKISAVNVIKTTQEYVRHTPILKTRFETKEGIFEVRDFMPRFIAGKGEYYCPSEIQRSIQVVSGNPKMIVELIARPNYGESGVSCLVTDEYIKLTSQQGQYNSFYIYTDLNPQALLEGQEIILQKSAYIVLSYHEKISTVDGELIYLEYERTKSYWLSWIYRTQAPKNYREQTLRSAITLKLLMYQKTGAILASVTTSLPEIIGKDRNWDYRYCWIRDASMIIDLYARLGHINSSGRYINFILNRMLLKDENISVLYGINGERELTEKTLDHLQGYQGSKPVRIGNAAFLQQQNDVYGELIAALDTYFSLHQRADFYLDQELWTVVRSLVNQAQEKWRQPDSGIWEYRGELKHHVYSKMMNWVAMDRAAHISRLLGKTDYMKKCLKFAEEIKADILEKGWNEKQKAFTMYYGAEELDAANLLMLHYGFLDAKDPRMISTIERSYEQLVRQNMVMRYVGEDDFGAPENIFIICTFWMINALYLIGKEKEARAMFEHILTRMNHLGLYSEGVDPKSGRLVGNFPQGYSHMAFIQTVLLLETNYSWGCDDLV